MGKALYRKHRSTSFSEVIGQEHITDTLSNAIASDKISHAYLFSGPRGVGKTSTARILAHEINQLDYSDSNQHLDIIEIDAASNRRIDEIRDLRDKVNIPPTSSKYKVYIIDEVHMLTKEAFNALLKTLEEPPEHCVFILATTEPHKVPETIISRTQRFDFKKIDNIQIAEHLREISVKEKINITDEALLLIARHGRGSFRDSIGMLDQLSSQSNKIEENDVRTVLGMPSTDKTAAILSAVSNNDVASLGAILQDLEDNQTNISGICYALADSVREEIINGEVSTKKLNLLKDLINVESSAMPWQKLLIVLTESMDYENRDKDIVVADKIPLLNQDQALTNHKEKELSKIKHTTRPSSREETTISTENTKGTTNDYNDIIDWWPEVVGKVKDQAASIYTALRLGTPILRDKHLELVFQFPLHQKKIDTAKNKDILSSIITDVTGKVYLISTSVDQSLKHSADKPSTNQKSTTDDPTLSSISNIFGSAEVLES